ncbi:27048_t:CDS:2 [Dentiscutata erythropus]|uniref:U6 snRNA phosphodiesterase 1 n=1 Tax=Dentiscutata erythropus TaxID=1348616 RepID=A0A9N9A8B8_9GLOM|nr:27048_t:CDS:2 [Dentiscutata erythropus]
MKGLVDYTSSSDNDSEEKSDHDINQSKKHKVTSHSEKEKGVKRKAEESDKHVETNKKRGSVLTPTVTTKKLPPLPLEFLELYQDERQKNYTKHIEDPSNHQGRIRTKPHVEGFQVITSENENLDDLDDETNFKFFHNDVTQPVNTPETLHISLSRPLFLKYFQIERFWDNLRKGFEDKKRFSLSFSEISHFINDEKTRSFLALEVGRGVNELKTLLEHVNKVAKDFRQEEFYENPRFHASILWSVGDVPIYESLRDALINSGFEDIIRDYVFIINKMVCKIGIKHGVTGDRTQGLLDANQALYR